MSTDDVHQSEHCSLNNVGLAKTNSFGDDDDDDTLASLSSYREDESKKMCCIPLEWTRIFEKDEIELVHENQATTPTHRAGDSELRSLELRVSNNVASPLLTGDHIKGVGGVPIKVMLVDSLTNEEVKSGPEASGQVKIAVRRVEDDGVRNECENILVTQIEGNKSRVSNLYLNLIEGTALLPSVSFTHISKWMKMATFRLEASFVDIFDGVRVKEAWTEPFVLKDRRNAAYKKHSFPSLHDDIWRLNKIGRNGLLARSLREEKIETVQDFIVRLFLHPQQLKEIFDRAKRAKHLEPAVKHARTCPAKLLYRSSFDQKTEVVFTVSGEVLGIFLDGQFVSSTTLCEIQKEAAKEYVISAFENWGDVISYDEEQFVAHCVHHVPNKPSSSNPARHRLAKTETVTPWMRWDGLDLHINESHLFGNVLSDGQHQSPDFPSESLRKRYYEIYNGFKSAIYASNPHEPQSVFGFVGTQADPRDRSYKRWRMVSWVVIFTRRYLPKMKNTHHIHVHKKTRLSYSAV